MHDEAHGGEDRARYRLTIPSCTISTDNPIVLKQPKHGASPAGDGIHSKGKKPAGKADQDDSALRLTPDRLQAIKAAMRQSQAQLAPRRPPVRREQAASDGGEAASVCGPIAQQNLQNLLKRKYAELKAKRDAAKAEHVPDRR